MSDQATGLPVRSEADGTDERVHSKIVGSPTGASPATNQVAVDNDKNAHVEVHGNDPAGLDRVVRLSELGAVTPDGAYHASNNTKPGNIGSIVHTRAATPGDSDQNLRQTGIKNGTVQAADVAILDSTGAPFSVNNPLPVTLTDPVGVETNDYLVSVAVAAGGLVIHDYTVTALKTLRLTEIIASASGKIKIEIQTETGVATGVFTTKFVQFNSTANPNIQLEIVAPISVAAGVRVRMIRTNKDNQPQDLYSTICGQEV